jgi:hypothetical protein
MQQPKWSWPLFVVVVCTVGVVVCGVLFVQHVLTDTKGSVCHPILLLIERPEPKDLSPSQLSSFNYSTRTYEQLYASLSC